MARRPREAPYGSPIEATAEELEKLLRENRPLLWVGAGASLAAGYPSTADLVRAMVGRASDPIPATLSFPEVADRFVASMGQGALDDLLEKLFRKPRQPTGFHHAVARLAKAGYLSSLITTNYDELLEDALRQAGVEHVVQPLDRNETLGADTFRVLKLHGTRDDWTRVILSGESYADFRRRYGFLCKLLDVLLRQHWVVFAGCSMKDPRILEWLGKLPARKAEQLKPWRPMMTGSDWDAVVAASREVKGGKHPLVRGKLRPLVLSSHEHLPALWKEAADRLAPVETGLERIALEVTVRADGWSLQAAGCAPWTVADPLVADRTLKVDLERLRELDFTPLPVREDGSLGPEAAALRAALERLAEDVGERLTRAVLSAEARELLARAARAGQGGRPALLHVRVRPEGTGSEAEARADAALALPWELLRLEGRFPVKEAALDVAREAVVEGLPGLDAPTRDLTLVATVAAPEDATALDHEDECFRLWKALGEDEKRLLLADVGTVEAFVEAVRYHRPAAVHFTGHGKPGELLFEDEAAYSAPLPVTELAARLRGDKLPRFFYLASCHGASGARRPAAEGQRGAAARLPDPAVLAGPGAPSSAASLHRAGFPQVVAYLGPVGDAQSTRTEAVLYRALVEGKTAREAVRRARQTASELPCDPAGVATHLYPLGWAQLALYHRGEKDEAVALAAGALGGADFLAAERRREQERLDSAGGAEAAGVHGLRRGFVGRRGPRAELIRRWRKGDRLAVVMGLGGLGKTALCTEALRVLGRYQGASTGGEVRALVFNGRAAGTAPGAVEALWSQVVASGPREAEAGEAWNDELKRLQEGGLTPEAVAGALRWLARQEGGLLVYLDDAESLHQEAPAGEGALGRWKDEAVARLWGLLVAEARPGGRFGLLASSRYVPEGTPEGRQVSLEPMREMDVLRLLRWHETLGRLPPEDAKWVAEKVDGHPRTVEYLEALASMRERELAGPGARYAGARWREEVLEEVLPATREKVDANLLLGRLWQALRPEAREHLAQCSVVKSPAPWQAVVHLGTASTAEELVRAGLLSPGPMPGVREKGWAPHGLVVREVEKHWSGDKKAANARLGQWYAERPEKERTFYSLTLAMVHLLAAQEANAAWGPAQSLVLMLRDDSRYREALRLCEWVLESGPTGAARGNALAWQAQLRRMAGMPLNNAEEQLQEASKLVDEQDHGFVLSELAGLYMQQGKWQAAAATLEKAIAVEVSVCGTDEHSNVAALLHQLARVLRAQGDFAGARGKFERSLAIKARLFGTEEHSSVATSIAELAGVLIDQGDFAGARRKFERALDIQRKSYGTRDHCNFALTEQNLARLLLQIGEEPERARELLGHALQVFRALLGPDHPYTRKTADLVAKMANDARS